MLDNIRKFLTIYTLLLDNILTFLRILLQLRKERAEITPWTILNNIRQYLTILYNIEQHWTIFGKILKYLTISSNIVSHLIPQKQTYAIPKFSVPLLSFFFTWASSRGAFTPKNKYLVFEKKYWEVEFIKSFTKILVSQSVFMLEIWLAS